MEHVSNLINKYHVGSDGHTPHGRLHGHEIDEELVEFGEQIMYYVPKKTRLNMD